MGGAAQSTKPELLGSRDLPPGLAFAYSVGDLGHITSVTTSMETSLLA